MACGLNLGSCHCLGEGFFGLFCWRLDWYVLNIIGYTFRHCNRFIIKNIELFELVVVLRYTMDAKKNAIVTVPVIVPCETTC